LLEHPNALFDVAEAILDAVLAAYEATDLEPPPRQFIAHGTPPFDCDGILAVSIPRLFAGLPNANDTSPIQCATNRSAEFQVWVGKCVPTVDEAAGTVILPSAEEMTESARDLAAHAWLISSAIIRSANAGTLVEEGTAVVLGDLVPVSPRGGIGAYVQALRVQVGV